MELSRSGWENFISQWRQSLLAVPYDIVRTQDLHDLYLEWCQVNKEHTLSETKFSLFVSTKVPKTTNQVYWVDDHGMKRRSMLFVPDIERPAMPALNDARAMGEAVKNWRRAAYWGGWSVDKWDKCKGFAIPLEGDPPRLAA